MPFPTPHSSTTFLLTKGEDKFASLITSAFRPGVYIGVVLPRNTFSILAGAENSIRCPEGATFDLILNFIALCGRESDLTLKVTPVVSSSSSEPESES
jgi:hypothetical protein